MKLASLRAGGRDGTLIVVSRDLSRAVKVPQIAPTLQNAIDNWATVEAALQGVYDQLNSGSASDAFELDVDALAPPLPRAYHFGDGSAYVKHVELVRKSRGAGLPPSFWTDPLIYQGHSDCFIGPTEPVPVPNADWGIDFEAEMVVITDDVPMGTTEAEADKHLKLFMLMNDVSLRNLIPGELDKGLGFFQGKPTSSFTPVAVTRDEFGDSWQNGTVNLEMRSTLRGQLFGHPRVDVDQTFTLARIVEHATKSRELGAGSLLATGTISNVDGNVGSSCIAEVRAAEMIEFGAPKTPYMQFGDTIRIEMIGADGQSIFGAIDQKIVPYVKAAA
jgi:fumarylacetoacetate (FAA) hydrolase